MITLKPQDIVILLKILAIEGRKWTYLGLSHELFMSASEIHSSIKRATISRLWDPIKVRPFRKALLEFLIYGVKYVFPANKGEITRGMPTSFAAPPLKGFIKNDEIPLIWPTSDGQTRGLGIAPLYKTVPNASSIDKVFYELLSLLDAIRAGNARERQIAEKILNERIYSLIN